MNAKGWMLSAGLGAAAGAVAVLMMPRQNPVRRVAAKAANKAEDLAWKVEDKMNEVLQITAARTEIEEFSHQLESFGLTLSDIADNCPRQERTMDACMKVLDYAKSHPQLLVQMIHSKKLPLAQLAAGSGTERKTLERHRKYLVAILLAYTNGFEIIRGHLQFMKRKEKPL